MLTKSDYWRYAAIGLLALNVALVAFLLTHRPPGGDALKHLVIERLQLDKAQVVAYETLIDQHRTGIREKEEAMLALKQQLYTSLAGENTALRDSLVQEIARVQTNIEQLHLAHFTEVKKLCRPEQMNGFQSVTNELARMLSPRRMPPPPGK